MDPPPVMFTLQVGGLEFRHSGQCLGECSFVFCTTLYMDEGLCWLFGVVLRESLLCAHAI